LPTCSGKTTGLTQRARQIDIWWGGHRVWEQANIRILSVVKDIELKNRLETGIKNLLPKTRIKASVHVIVGEGHFSEILHQNSQNSDIVFLGLPRIQEGGEIQAAKDMDALCSGDRRARSEQ
jgi:hypothetical protein